MPRRQFGIPAAVLLLTVAPSAKAGPTIYTWGPLQGYGYYFDFHTGQTTYFSSRGGEITIGYDPNNLQDSYIRVTTGTRSTGEPGLEADANFGFTVHTGGADFEAHDSQGTYVGVEIFGDPGPLNRDGDPLSLAPLLGDPFSVDVVQGYHSGFTFFGEPGPEPSTLVMLPLGLAGVALAGAARPARRGRDLEGTPAAPPRA